MVINIDDFGGINDRFGLEYGDRTLVDLGEDLSGWRNDATIWQGLGSDRFAIVTPNTNIPSLTDACRALVEDLAQIFEVGRLRL